MLLIPIGDENYGERKPIVNYILIGLNVAVFFFVTLPARDYQTIVDHYGVVPRDLRLISLVTSMFLHNGLMHLIGNMLFLYIFGDNIERKLGHVGYLVFYMLTGFVAGLAYYATGIKGIPAIGASGAISGVLGAYLFLFRNNRIKIFYWFIFFIGTFHITALWGIGLWILQNVLFYLAESGTPGSGVAYIAHIGGFAAGFAGVGALYLAGMVKPGEKRHTVHGRWAQPEAAGWGGRRFGPGPAAAGRRVRHKLSTIRERKPDREGADIRKLAKSGDFMELMDSYRRALQYYGIGTLPRQVEEEIAKRALAEGRFLVAANTFLELTSHHGSGPNLGYYHGMLGIVHADHLDNFALAYRHLRKSMELGVDAKLKKQVESHLGRLDEFFSEPLLAESPGNLYALAAVGGTEIPATNVGRLVAGRLGRPPVDVTTQIHQTGGLLAENVPEQAAVKITKELNNEGLPTIAIPQEALLQLPPAEEIDFATATENGLRFRGFTGADSLVPWDNIHVANVIQLEGRERRGPGFSIPAVGTVLDVLTAKPAQRLRFKEQNFTPGVDSDGEVRGFEWFMLGVAANCGGGIYGQDVAAAALGGQWQRGPQSTFSRFDRQTHFLLQRALVRLARL